MRVTFLAPPGQQAIVAAAEVRLAAILSDVVPLRPEEKRQPWQLLRCLGDKPDRSRVER